MSISKRPGSPFWYIQFQYNGKSYIKSSKTTDKKLAAKLETQWRSELIQQQQFGFIPTLSLIEAFQSYSASKQHLACAYYVRLWSDRAIEFWSKKDYIHEISSLEIERFNAYLANAGYKPQTIVHALNQVGGAIKFAKKMGYKVQEVELPSIKLPRGRLRYLSVEEEQRLLQVLEPTASPKWMSEFTAPEIKREMQDLYDIVILLIDTGARHTEISTLRWECVNLDDGSIRLWRSKVQNESVLYPCESVIPDGHRFHPCTQLDSLCVGCNIFTVQVAEVTKTMTANVGQRVNRIDLAELNRCGCCNDSAQTEQWPPCWRTHSCVGSDLATRRYLRIVLYRYVGAPFGVHVAPSMNARKITSRCSSFNRV